MTKGTTQHASRKSRKKLYISIRNSRGVTLERISIVNVSNPRDTALKIKELLKLILPDNIS